jgi:flagellum-specific ATP synthase
MAAYERMEELIRIGAYKAGSDAELDRAIRLRAPLEAVLAQEREEAVSLEAGFAALRFALES